MFRTGATAHRLSFARVLLLSVIGVAGCLAPSQSTPSGSPFASGASGAPGTPSGGATANASVAAFDACALMTPEGLSAIVGGPAPVAKPVPAGGWVAGQCAWSSPTAAFLISVGTQASIASVGDPTVQDAKGKLKEFERRVSATGTSTAVTGIGDGAIATEGSVAATKGDVYLEVVGLRLTNEQSIEVMKLAVAAV